MTTAPFAAARRNAEAPNAGRSPEGDPSAIDLLRTHAFALGRFEAACIDVALTAATALSADGEARAAALVDLDETVSALDDIAKRAVSRDRDAVTVLVVEALKEAEVDVAPFDAALRKAEALRAAFDADGAPRPETVRAFGAFARERARETTQTAMTALLAKVDRLERASLGDASEARSLIDQTLTEIEEISLSVRLISLNASVEAARAGAAGRGFGVIASEIQNLAVRAQSSVDSVRTQIRDLSL